MIAISAMMNCLSEITQSFHRHGRVLLATILPALALSLFVTSTHAQVRITTGIAPGAVGCGASGNGTGHMVCAEYTVNGQLVGVSWQVPGPMHNPAEAPLTEPIGQIDTMLLPALAGTPAGRPGCAPSNDFAVPLKNNRHNNSGTQNCLLISRAGSGFVLQGIAFYPPGRTMSALQSLGNEPATAAMSSPACASASTIVNTNNAPPSDRVVVCTLIVDGQLYAVGFDPTTGISTGLTALQLGGGFSGDPSCDSLELSPVVACAARSGGGLLGFAVQFAGGQLPPAVSTVTAVASLLLPANSFAGSPSCVLAGPGNLAVTCAIVSENNLLGVNFDLQANTHSGYQALGAPPDGGTWTGSVGCAVFPDFRKNETPNAGLVSCAVVSDTSNIFDATFNPTTVVSLGVRGPFSTHANATLSCISLAVDLDQIYCGETTTDGASSGSRLPVGRLPQSLWPAVTAVF